MSQTVSTSGTIDSEAEAGCHGVTGDQRFLEQLHRMQEDLENYFIAKSELEEQLALKNSMLIDAERKLRELSQELDWKEKCIGDLRRSWSWRLTKPIRSLGSLFSALSGKKRPFESIKQ